MTASITFYDSWKENIGKAANLSSDTFKLVLVTSSYTFSAAHDEYADVTNELSTANGYTSGGQALASVTWAQTSGTAKFDAADTAWTASGGSLVFRRGILYDDTVSADPLVCAILFDTTPADITVLNGNTFTVQWNASGIYTLA